MESSRIFVRNLPPTINEADFRKHFSTKGREITDIKVIPRRRIGYVGYKTPEDAVAAAKYFNHSFIRLSRIAVEMARPISDPSLPASRKVRTGQATLQAVPQEKPPERPVDVSTSEAPSLKRKREEVNPSDPTLQEFLATMQPGKRDIRNMDVEQTILETGPERDMADLDRDSDNEYEEIPARPTKKPATKARSIDTIEQAEPTPRPERPDMPADDPSLNQPAETTETSKIAAADAVNSMGATDDDWLRSRTNRLLDLIDPDDPISDDAHSHPARSEPAVAQKSRETNPPPRPAEEVQLERNDDGLDLIRKTSRLFVRNLPYSATEDDLRKHFKAYGHLEEVHLAVGSSGTSKGYALVLYSDPSSAIDAFQGSDGKTFQGRILHVLPAQAKKDSKLDEFAMSKLPLKKQNLIRKKAEAASNFFNWNALYMSQDAVNASMADRLGVSKADLLDPSSTDAGVKQALAETSIIQETKAYFASNGVDLDAFKSRQRGDTTILVKNFSYGTTLEELRKMFEEHGTVLRLLMPPSGTIAIAQFAQASQARAAFASLAYRRIKESVLFLEKGPVDLFKEGSSSQHGEGQESTQVLTDPAHASAALTQKQKLSVAELLERDDAQDLPETTSLFVRGLNFATTTEKLAETFKPLDGFVSARVKTKPDPKKPGQILSMGFGFVEFRTKEQAHAALKTMDGYSLESHTLTVKASHRGLDAAEERRREDKAKKLAGQHTKIVIKNLPFEASKKDVRQLFGTYGQLRAVRVPKKFGGSSTRGFAFAEFTTPREAENALNALRDTHLLGRKLVLDFAEAEAVDAEEEIAKMTRKTGGRFGKVMMHQLTGMGRQKVTIGQGDEEEA